MDIVRTCSNDVELVYERLASPVNFFLIEREFEDEHRRAAEDSMTFMKLSNYCRIPSIA